MTDGLESWQFLHTDGRVYCVDCNYRDGEHEDGCFRAPYYEPGDEILLDGGDEPLSGASHLAEWEMK